MWSSSTRAYKYELALVIDLALESNILLINLTNRGETLQQNWFEFQISKQQVSYHALNFYKYSSYFAV
jgi:hypothetical protein